MVREKEFFPAYFAPFSGNFTAVPDCQIDEHPDQPRGVNLE